MASLISDSCLRHNTQHFVLISSPGCLRCLDPDVNVSISRDFGHGLAQNADCMNSLSELCESGGMIDKIVSFDAPLF